MCEVTRDVVREQPEGGRITIREAQPGEKPECEGILRALPEWFGIEEAITAYMTEIEDMATYLALDGERLIGFLALNFHNEYTAEVHVMGVRPEFHGRGAGTALIEHANSVARERGYEYLEVKTLGPSHPDTNYARTREFYLSRGFRPLEEIEDLWPGNPCLIMVKRL